MNILFIGPYRSLSGWGEAARQYIRALQKTGHNISIKPVNYGDRQIDVDDDFKFLERTHSSKFDAVIQNVLPEDYVYDRSFGINIGLSYFETSCQNNIWANKLKLMDQIWVPSIADRYNILNYNNTLCNDKIRCLPIPVNTTKFEVSYKVSDKTGFKFYFIGEFIQRKNLDLLIRAFHTEFGLHEPVELYIKTNTNSKILEDYISNVKSKLRIYKSLDKYKKEHLITHRLTEEQMIHLHVLCDCFVMPSSGESQCLPMVDAVGFGNIPIVTKHTGMDCGIINNCGFLVNSKLTSCYVDDPPLDYLYTAKDRWFEPNILDLQTCMRMAYNLSDEQKKKRVGNGLNYIYNKLTYSKIAEQINQYLTT